MKYNIRNTAKLISANLEVARSRKGRPHYVWVEGYKVITPAGRELAPYMRKKEAKSFCKTQGWTFEIV